MFGHILAQTTVKIKDNKGNWVKQNAIFDLEASQSMISSSLAKKLGLKNCDSSIGNCSYIQVKALIQGHWLELRDEVGTGTVLVWWVPSTAGVCFSKSVLENTKQTTIVEEVEEEEKEEETEDD